MRRVALVSAVAACVVAGAAGAARADVAVIDDAGTPFDGGVPVTSPLEQVAGRIASTIAGRPVSIRCEDDGDWSAILSSFRFRVDSVLGFVTFTHGAPVSFAELSPDVCRSLQSFAAATTKPTKCTTHAELRTAKKTVRQKIVKKVNGKKVTTWRTRKIEETTLVDVPLSVPAICFAGGRELSNDRPFWDNFFYTAEALQTLVHESIHLEGEPVEARAECYGMQWLAYAAQQLGDTEDDAAAITAYYVTRLYPARQTQAPEYWSADCVANGPLDLTPNDGVWP